MSHSSKGKFTEKHHQGPYCLRLLGIWREEFRYCCLCSYHQVPMHSSIYIRDEASHKFLTNTVLSECPFFFKLALLKGSIFWIYQLTMSYASSRKGKGLGRRVTYCHSDKRIVHRHSGLYGTVTITTIQMTFLAQTMLEIILPVLGVIWLRVYKMKTFY